MTSREAGAFAAVVDAVVAPEPPLPPVLGTDAVAAFEAMLERAPRLNAAALRTGLVLLDAAPRLAGRPRMHGMPRHERLAFLHALERLPRARPVLEALRTAAAVSYYGDAGVLGVLER